MMENFMSPAAQFVFNVLISLVMFLGGWVLNSVKSSIEHLQRADRTLTEKLQAVELLVAGNYVKKEDLAHNVEAIFKKLDRIETKLDSKVDK